MPPPVLSYGTSRPRSARRWLAAALLLTLALYSAGYLYLRTEHVFVHNATGYTGDDDRWVPTDTVDFGDFLYVAPEYALAYYLYTPARWAEAWFWRRWPRR